MNNKNLDFLKNKKKYRILVVQDNIGDLISLQRAIVRIQANIQLQVIKSGLEMQSIINENSLQPIPDLILLDINLPGVNGLDLLKLIKQHKKYKQIPVIILTTSQRQHQINLAYKYHANTYFSKKIQPQQIDSFLTMLNNYWFDSAYSACLPVNQQE